MHGCSDLTCYCVLGMKWVDPISIWRQCLANDVLAAQLCRLTWRMGLVLCGVKQFLCSVCVSPLSVEFEDCNHNKNQG